MDKEVLLHIIDGPGSTWGWIVFSIVAGLVIVFLVRTFSGYASAFQKGREAERRDGFAHIRAQMCSLDRRQAVGDSGTG
jgi:hypothetical protein